MLRIVLNFVLYLHSDSRRIFFSSFFSELCHFICIQHLFFIVAYIYIVKIISFKKTLIFLCKMVRTMQNQNHLNKHMYSEFKFSCNINAVSQSRI